MKKRAYLLPGRSHLQQVGVGSESRPPKNRTAGAESQALPADAMSSRPDLTADRTGQPTFSRRHPGCG